MVNQPNNRHKELGKIHIAKKQLDMDDVDYRNMLFTIARVRSAADLDEQGRHDVLAHFRSLGFKAKRKSYPGRPHNTDENPQLRKIEALLADNKLPWSYADAICKRMYQKDRLTFCDSTQLSAVITALIKDTERKK